MGQRLKLPSRSLRAGSRAPPRPRPGLPRAQPGAALHLSRAGRGRHLRPRRRRGTRQCCELCVGGSWRARPGDLLRPRVGARVEQPPGLHWAASSVLGALLAAPRTLAPPRPSGREGRRARPPLRGWDGDQRPGTRLRASRGPAHPGPAASRASRGDTRRAPTPGASAAALLVGRKTGTGLAEGLEGAPCAGGRGRAGADARENNDPEARAARRTSWTVAPNHPLGSAPPRAPSSFRHPAPKK